MPKRRPQPMATLPPTFLFSTVILALFSQSADAIYSKLNQCPLTGNLKDSSNIYLVITKNV